MEYLYPFTTLRSEAFCCPSFLAMYDLDVRIVTSSFCWRCLLQEQHYSILHRLSGSRHRLSGSFSRTLIK